MDEETFEREARDRELEKVPPPIGPSDPPHHREPLIEAFLQAREEIRAEVGTDQLQLVGWLVWIEDELVEVSKAARLSMIAEEGAGRDAALGACRRFLVRLGAASVEALESISDGRNAE